MIFNMLDNAFEASGAWLQLVVTREAETLVLSCIDNGPGFAATTLSQLGKPYNSTKGRPGGGLGLFLVFNVARTLGGQVRASNRSEGGARVTIRLPLSALTLDADDDKKGLA
jgi:two-component system sensor histidine kinase RegB